MKFIIAVAESIIFLTHPAHCCRSAVCYYYLDPFQVQSFLREKRNNPLENYYTSCVSLPENIDQESPPESLVKLEVILSSQTFPGPPVLPLLYFHMWPPLFYFCVPIVPLPHKNLTYG